MLNPLRAFQKTIRSWFTAPKTAGVTKRRRHKFGPMPLGVRLELESLEQRINPTTTLNSLHGGLQILVAGGDTVNLSTANGMLVVNDATAGQTITDNTNKFTIVGAAGNQTATENTPLTGDFTSITISGTGAGQTVHFIGGSFIATTVNDGTIANVGFSAAPSSFLGDLNVLTSTSLTQSAAISGTSAINLLVGGSNAALNLNANVTSQTGPVTLQATGAVTVGAGVALESDDGALTLGADLTSAGAGDDGIGTLTLAADVTTYGTSVNLRGADVNIAPTATVGSAIVTEPEMTIFIDNTHGMSQPSGPVIDQSGNLYVANYQGDSIFRITPSGAVSTFVASSLLQGPEDMCFDSRGNLYVSNYLGNTISEITPSGVISTFIDSTHGLNGPYGLAFDSQGNLYIANHGGNTISKATPTGAVTTFVDNTHGLNSPDGLAFDSSGNLFVANEQAQNILKITPAGVVSTFVSSSLGLFPGGFAFDTSGNLYATTGYYPTPTLAKITPAGLVTFVHPYPATGGQVDISNLAMDGSGNLYFADSSTNTIDKISTTTFLATTTQVTVHSSLPSRPMSLGGSNNSAVAGINLTSAELACLVTQSGGGIMFGDSTQTGPITISTATLAPTPGASTTILESATGSGQVILDDGGGSGTALNGNGGAIFITAGTGGIIALSAANNAAELATTGTVHLDTTGPIGSATNPIQFADSGSSTQESIYIGATYRPSSVFLDGLGSLTLANLQAGSSAPVTVTARTNLVVSANAIVTTPGATLSLGADLTAAGSGNDGVGTLTIGSEATVFGTNINLRGADFNVSPYAVIGSMGYLPSAVLTGAGFFPIAMAFDKNGDLFVRDSESDPTGYDAIREYAPGSTVPTAYLTFPIATLVIPIKGLAVDSSGNLYVGTYPSSGSGTVSVFAPGSTTPTTTLTGLVNQFPDALTFDSAGNLYVADGYYVEVYAPGSTPPTSRLTGAGNPYAFAFDSHGDLFVANGNGVTEFLSGSTTPYATLTGMASGSATALAFDASGNLYVADAHTDLAYMYAPGATTPTATLTGLDDPRSVVVDKSGNIYFANFGPSATVAKFLPGTTTPAALYPFNSGAQALAFDANGDLYVADETTINVYAATSPAAASITIGSSLPTRPMSIGGTNDAAVAGINLTNAELAAFITAPNGTLTFGDSSQTGNITFSTATPLSTAGAHVVALQSTSGAGAIILDDGGGKASALNANGGTVSLTSGTGGIQVLSAPNNVPEISNASTVSLTSSAGIGISDPLELASVSNLITNTTTANGAQFLNAIGTVGPASLNAGIGAITLGGNGTLLLAGNSVNASTLIVTGSGSTAVTVKSGQRLEGSGSTGPVTVQAGGFLGSSAAVSTLSDSSLSLQAGSTFDVTLNGTGNYTRALILPSGTVSLGGANLVLSGTLTPANGQSFTIIKNFGSQTISGTFNGLPEGAVIPNFLGSGLSATISYVGGDGNDVVLTVGSAPPSVTAVTASSGTAVYGQSVTFTATVTVSGGTQAGSVEFFDARTGADLGSGTLQTSGNGAAIWTYATAPTQLNDPGSGRDRIEALYGSSGVFASSMGSTTEAIAPAALTLSGVTAANKVYDHTTVATLNLSGVSLVGAVSGDAVTLVTAAATGTFASANVGTAIPVTLAGLSLTGAQAADYTLLLPTLSANITQRPITITANAETKVVGAPDPALTYQITAGSMAPGESLTGALTRQAGQTMGYYGILQGTLAATSNYALTYVGALLTINPQLVITNITPNPVTAGGTVNVTVTAEDNSNNVVPGYLHGVKITSTDGSALYNSAALPTNYDFVKSDSGSHTFTITLFTAGTTTITFTDDGNAAFTATTGPITVTAAPFSKFVLGVQGGNTVTAGTPFLVTAQATDSLGNPANGAGVPTNIAASASPTDPLANYSISSPVNSSGFAFFLGTLDTAGSYTITAGGASTSVTVVPASPTYFTVSAPSTATTGIPFNLTVKAFDQYGNLANGYTGTVSVISTDPAASILVPSYTFTSADGGVHTFGVYLDSSTLAGAAGTMIVARDTTATSPPIAGFSSAITVQGLVVAPGGFQPTATGFAVTFSKPFTPADLTLYGSNLTTVPDVTLVGAKSGIIPGSLYIDPTTPNTLVFKASSAYLLALNAGDGFGPGGTGDVSAALPDDTYTVTLISGTGSNGFLDALGTHLDGLGNGTAANYTATFTTTYQDDAHNNAHPTPILAIPDFARGPDSVDTITVPNNKTAPGIPVTLYNVTNSVTDATFTLTFNPQIFMPTAGGTGDAPAGSTFTMGTITSIDSTHASVAFIYHNATSQTGTIVLGDILATVPTSAASIYKTAELLALGNISITGGATVLASDGIHVDAYLGDVHVTAAPVIDASDALDASKVAAGAWTGFSAYTLLDPALIGGFVSGHTISVDAADVTALFTKAAHGNVPTLPNIPSAVSAVSVGGADAAVSVSAGAATTNGILSVAGASVPLVSQATGNGQRLVTDVGATGGPLTISSVNATSQQTPQTPQAWPGLSNGTLAGQSFEVGVAPALNWLLLANSPGQQAVDWVLADLAENTPADGWAGLWDGEVWNHDWLALGR